MYDMALHRAHDGPLLGAPDQSGIRPGGTFSHTFIYGTYDGRVTFFQSMFTKAMLVPGITIEQLAWQPAVYEVTGKWFLIHYIIRHDDNADKYIISLKNVVMR